MAKDKEEVSTPSFSPKLKLYNNKAWLIDQKSSKIIIVPYCPRGSLGGPPVSNAHGSLLMLWLFPGSRLVFPNSAAWTNSSCSLAVQLPYFAVDGSSRLVLPHCCFLFQKVVKPIPLFFQHHSFGLYFDLSFHHYAWLGEDGGLATPVNHLYLQRDWWIPVQCNSPSLPSRGNSLFWFPFVLITNTVDFWK